jgi:hypothetical protein
MVKEIVLDLLKTTLEASEALESHVYRIFGAGGEAKQWTTNPQARKQIETKLAERGYPFSKILARAYMKGANQIDAVERRMASCEIRRSAALREIERRNSNLAQRLDKASSDVIDAEFSEAAE